MSPQITLFAHGIAPNPPKVAILLEELNVEYAIVERVGSPTYASDCLTLALLIRNSETVQTA